MYMTRYGKTEHTASLIRAVRSVQATYAAVSVVFHNKEKILNSPIWYVPKNPPHAGLGLQVSFISWLKTPERMKNRKKDADAGETDKHENSVWH